MGIVSTASHRSDNLATLAKAFARLFECSGRPSAEHKAKVAKVGLQE